MKYADVKLSPKLEKFLRKEKLLTKAKKYTAADNGYITEAFKSLDDAFLFCATKEGHDFWWEIHKKFKNEQ